MCLARGTPTGQVSWPFVVAAGSQGGGERGLLVRSLHSNLRPNGLVCNWLYPSRAVRVSLLLAALRIHACCHPAPRAWHADRLHQESQTPELLLPD